MLNKYLKMRLLSEKKHKKNPKPSFGFLKYSLVTN